MAAALFFLVILLSQGSPTLLEAAPNQNQLKDRPPFASDESLDPNWKRLESQLKTLDSELYFSCGRNALYLFVQFLGHTNVSFDQLKPVVPLTSPYGTSLKTMLDASQKLGVSTEVRLYNPEDYDAIPLPAIIHMRRSGQVMAAAHYDVLYKRDSERVHLVNGTTGKNYSIRRTRFGGEYWTGYALIEKRSLLSRILERSWPFLAAGFIVIDSALLALWLRKIARSRNDSGPVKKPSALKSAGASTLVVALLLPAFVPSVCTLEAATAAESWRSPRNQGINVLYCYLQVYGVACSYSDLVRDQAEKVGTDSFSAATLINMAAGYGVRLNAASLTMNELDVCRKPVVAYMTSDTPDDGAFVLVLNSVENEVFYIDGATATMQTMSREKFRRAWSGIVLLPAAGQVSNWIFFGLASGAGLAGGWWVRSRTNNRASQKSRK